MSKILLFVSGNFSLGGLETHLVTYFKSLKQRGYRLYFLTSIAKDIYIPTELNLYVDKIFDIGVTDYSSTSILKFYSKTKDIIEHYKIDVVHLHPFISMHGGFLAASEKNIPTVITLHGKISLFSSEDTSGFFLENVVLPNSLVFCVNEALYKEIKEIYGYQNLYYLANPIDNDLFKQKNKNISEQRYILIVSRLDVDKFDGLKHALSVLSEEADSLNFHIKVVGEGNKKTELNKLFSKKQCEFLGYKSSKEVAYLMHGALAVGGMGRVVLESLFVHTPTFLIGYDKIKGFVDENIFEKAKITNFNGNNIDNMEENKFKKELYEITTNRHLKKFTNMYEKAAKEYSSNHIIEQYMKIVEKYTDSFKTKGTYKDYTKKTSLLYMDFLIINSKLEKTESALNKSQTEIENLKKEKNELIKSFNEEKNALIKSFNEEKEQLRSHLTYAQERLNDIYNSNFWKVASSYYAIRDNVPPFKIAYKIFKSAKNKGITSIGKQAIGKVEKKYERLIDKRKHSKELLYILRKYRDRIVVIFPPIMDWNIPLFQRPQHLAKNLAKHGILYFYCTNNIQYDDINGFKKISNGCYLTNRFDLIDNIKNRKKYYDLLSGDLSTDWGFIKDRLDRKDGIIYQYIDKIHHNISGVEIPKKVLQKHFNILKDERCIVISSATNLQEEVEKYRHTNYKLVTNGVEIEHFSAFINYNEYPDIIKKIVDKNKPIIGYFGAFASWFDYKLIEKLAKQNTNFEILLLGWDYDGSIKNSGLDALNNVSILGPIPYKQLPYYASCFSVATIPFLVNDITKSTSPIKLFEYMAMRKPIVTTDMPECRKYRSVLVSKNHKDFMNKIYEALNLVNDSHYLDTLHKEANKNSWEAKAKEIAELILLNKDNA